MLADFPIFFTVVFSNKFAKKHVPFCSLHLRCVAALPCETWKFKIQPFSVMAFTNFPKNRCLGI